MSAENNKALVRRYVEEVLNQRNLAVVDELIASTFVDHDPSMPEARGPSGIKRLAAMVHASFPDLHFKIEDMIAEGDKVVYRYSVRGTHQKDFIVDVRHLQVDEFRNPQSGGIDGHQDGAVFEVRRALEKCSYFGRAQHHR
jgi:predicted ester cyclase